MHVVVAAFQLYVCRYTYLSDVNDILIFLTNEPILYWSKEEDDGIVDENSIISWSRQGNDAKRVHASIPICVYLATRTYSGDRNMYLRVRALLFLVYDVRVRLKSPRRDAPSKSTNEISSCMYAEFFNTPIAIHICCLRKKRGRNIASAA